MPLYEYRCVQCHFHLEILQKVGDKPLKACPKCGGQLERLLSPPSLQFKGSGWYVNDYGRANHGNGRSAQGNGRDKEKEKGPEEKTKPTAETSKSEPSK
ncbi:MAG: FmdB family zinc ribbon protein [Candidatus Aminicenantales bacterium]